MQREPASFGLAALALVTLAAVSSACGPSILWSGHTEDRGTRIEVVESGGITYVAMDGVRRGGYRGISVPSLRLAGDHVAFAARVANHWVVAVDGINGPAFDAIGELVLAPSGRVAYAALRAKKWHVVVDGAAGPAFDAIMAGTLQLTEHGAIYVAQNGSGTHVVSRTGTGPAFDGIGQLVVDGEHVAYVGRRGDDVHVVHDGAPSSPWAAIKLLKLAGDRVAYAASNGDEWRVIAGDVTYPKVDKVHQIWIRSDGAHVAWLGTLGGARMLALGEIPLVTSPALREDRIGFAPTASTTDVGLAYVEATPEGQHLVVDGAAGPTFDEVRTPVWNRAGQVAYTARRGKTWFVVAGGLEHGHAEWVSDPVLGDDGTLGYVRRQDKRTDVVVGGVAHRFALAFEDTLVIRNGHWAIAAGDVAHEALFISIDGRRKVPVTSHEVYSTAVNGTPGDQLKRWTERELGRLGAR